MQTLNETPSEAPNQELRPRAGRRHQKRQWVTASVALAVVLVFAVAAVFIRLEPVPAPLALPTAHAGSPVGPLEGSWKVAAGSVAGFRVRETVLFMSNDVVGRTRAVTGRLVFSNNRITLARFRVELTTVKVRGKSQPQFDKSLGTSAQPAATFTLTKPMTLTAGFASGATNKTIATGMLSMHRTSRLVSFTVSSRRYGHTIEAAGSVPIEFSDWAIRAPTGFGPLGSLSDQGVAEFLLVLERS